MTLQASSDQISKRIADVIQPANNAVVEKKVPLSWEEEELTNYEPKRAKAVEQKNLADARAALLVRQLPFQWNALREVISIRCESINAKACRTILRSVDPDRNRLEIRREDDLGIVMQFDPAKRKITFTGKVLGYDREYELIVQTHDGVDSTIWFSPTTMGTDQTDDLAKSLIATLLRFDQ